MKILMYLALFFVISGCGSSAEWPKTEIPITFHVFEKGHEAKALKITDVPSQGAVSQWWDNLATRQKSISRVSYAPSKMIRTNGWNANFTGDLIVINVKIEDVWQQYEFSRTVDDSRIIALVEGTKGAD
jgi:hypothetical protein